METSSQICSICHLSLSCPFEYSVASVASCNECKESNPDNCTSCHYYKHPPLPILLRFYGYAEDTFFSKYDQWIMRHLYWNHDDINDMYHDIRSVFSSKLLLPLKFIVEKFPVDQIEKQCFLPFASALNWEEGFQFLLDSGFDINQRHWDGRTPYSIAAEKCSPSGFRRLRAAGLPLQGNTELKVLYCGIYSVRIPNRDHNRDHSRDHNLRRRITECAFHIFELRNSFDISGVSFAEEAKEDVWRYYARLLIYGHINSPDSLIRLLPPELVLLIIGFL